MPVPNITVSLSEVLEVRGSPLTETEIWALLGMAAEVLQDSFISEQAISEFGPVFVINPDTISLTPRGQIEFGHAQQVQQYANYMAPETEEGFVMTATAVEQMYVYALGKSLVYSAEFGLNPEEPLKISRGLESLLGSMTNRNPTQRTALINVLEACNVQSARSQRGRQSLNHIVLDLYRTVLGIEGQEEKMPDISQTSDRYRPKTSSTQETDPDRSRRKKRRSRNSDRNKKRSPVQRYRSRSRSRSSSYSRSRSHSKQNGNDRGRKRSDSLDSGYHRHTPLDDENYGISSRPSLHSGANSTGRSYHLSDITFSASQNGQNSKRKSSSKRPDSRQSRTGNKLQTNGNVKGSLKDSDIRENPAFRKYLKLKERQRKLRALRGGIMDSTESDELSDIVMDHMSETRSVMSLVSHSQGAYRPDIHKQYGSNSALRMGHESDLESIVSSDVSLFGHDNQALRANGDISDPYIQQLQQMTAAPPPPLVFAPRPPVRKKKHGAPTQVPQKHPPLPPPQKHKEYYGPEFVHHSTKPIQRLAISLQGESRKHPGHVCRVVIVLLNGQKLEVMCDPSTTGQQLFEAIVTHIELPEFYFFGLTYVSDDEHFFIPGETKLHKVAPDGWRESWKFQSAPVTFTVYLRVKFYVENTAILKHKTTRHQLYLQLRRDLLEERCQCDETKALSLAGLALQAEYGDYSQENMGRNYFVPEHYFPGRAVKRLGTEYIRDNTPEAHMDARGLTESEAEIEFIKFVQEHLPEYGTHFHKLLKKKGDNSNTIWIGLNINEMVFAENSGDQRIIIQHHPWGAIQKISFNRRRFSVQPRPDIGQVKPVKMNFFTTTYRKGQYLLKFCTAQHSFQLKMKSRLAMADDSGIDPTIPDHESIGNTEDMDGRSTDDEGTITEEHINPREADLEMQAAGYTDTGDQDQPIVYRTPPPYRPHKGSSLIDLPGPKLNTLKPEPGPRAATSDFQTDGADQSRPVTSPGEGTDQIVEEAIKPSQASSTDRAYVIDMSTGSMDQTLTPPSGNETISNTLCQRFKDDLLSPESSTVEPEIFDVILPKDPELGFGITIVGGDNNRQPDLGLFVKSVAVNTPAHRDGRIKPGDKILAINDCSVEGLQHQEAAKMIKNSSSHVKLKISQVKPPRSLRKKDNDISPFRMKMKSYDTKELDKDILTSDAKSSPPVRKSRPSGGADEITTPVITVDDCVSIQSEDESDKNNKKKDGQMRNIPNDVNMREQGVRSLADIHSTLSQVDSLNSETDVQELPVDEQNSIVEIHEDSDTDSDFDSRIDAVINETPVVDEEILAETEEKVMAANRKPSEDASETPTETFEVFLEKKRGSFGLNVTGGVNTSVRYGGIYVKSVVPDGAADEEGTIQKGDRILMVDNIKLEGFTHKQAVQTLCEAPPFCKLVIERGLIIPSRPDSAGSRQSQTSANGPKAYRYDQNTVLASYLSTEQINVLDMSVTGTTTEDGAGQGEPDVKVVVDEMYIDQNQSGERRNLMLAINQLYESFITNENCYQVRLKKGTQGLGFSIIGGEAQAEEDLDTLHYVTRIKRVFPIGPAADSGKIEAGDVILSVNGHDMRKLTHAETLLALRTAGKTVTLILCRPEPGILPPLLFLDQKIFDKLYKESQESFELTPASSSCSESSDDESDNNSNDGEITPAREMLITPPTGYSPHKYPVDENGTIIPKIISPPPPLPKSPPPALPQSPPPTLIRSGSVTPHSVTEGVAELMDSCRSEMIEIQHSSKNKPDDRNTTPIVREFSTLGFETPSEATPVNVTECSTVGSEDLNSVNIDTLNTTSNSSETSTLKVLRIDKTVTAGSPTMLKRGDACDEYDSDSESTASSVSNNSTSMTNTRQDTSLADDFRLDSSLADSKQDFLLADLKGEISVPDSNLQISLADSGPDSSFEQENTQSLVETDQYETSLDETYVIQTEQSTPDAVNECSESVLSNNDCNINVDNDQKYVNEDDVNNDDIDANLKLLEQKYIDIDEADENGDSTESEESTSTDDEQSSVRETFSQSVEETLQPGELDVTLTKPDGKGLGFTVAGGASTTGGCYIKAVLQNPALSDGRLKPGDRLIKVNGIDMRSLNHFEAVTVLREAADQVVIRVYREPKDDLDLNRVDETDNHGQALMGSPVGHIEDEVVEEGTLETESLDEQSSESESEDSSQDGELENRDPVCEDGKPVYETDNKEPVQDMDSLDKKTVDRSPVQDQSKLLEESLSRAPAEGGASDGKNQSGDGESEKKTLLSSPRSPRSPEVSVCQIDLEKPSTGGLGISLVTGETENQTGVFICTISPGGVAHTDGRLRVGDKLLQINGQSLVGLNHSKAATILRHSEGRVMLTVSRDRGKKPKWLESDEESQSKEAETSDKLDRAYMKAGTVADSDSEQSEIEDDSSLSLTKHLPEDIKDDNVDSLVFEAEKLLKNADNVLEQDIVTESVLKSQGVTGAQCMPDNQTKTVNNEQGLDDKTHRYLRAAETIEYHHNELDPEAESEQTEVDNDNSSKATSDKDSDIDEDEDIEGNSEEDFVVDGDSENSQEIASVQKDDQKSDTGNADQDDQIDDNGASNTVEDVDDDDDFASRCWCDSLRRLDIPVPDEVTVEWLYNLSLATVPEDVKSSIPGLIAELQEKIEVDDPQEEFKQLRTVKSTDSCSAAALVYNRDKNRFRNVLPYDLNRVRLSDDSSTDYINASHVQIDISGVICNYIACQGPLPHTTVDFWEMIWLHDVSVIVMLTRDMEAGKVKCHRYWPDSVDTPLELDDGRYRLSLLYENVLEDFDIRSILIENTETGESRSVCHLNYTTWPDHGVPQSAVPLLQCMRLSHELRVSGPLVVHCSAGIGRTGTFITIDVALAHTEKGLKCEILDIVTELRRQRQGMIQTRDQYLFCYTAIIEALLRNTN